MLKGKSYAPLTSCSWHMKRQEIEGCTWWKRKKRNEVMGKHSTTCCLADFSIDDRKVRPEGDSSESHYEKNYVLSYALVILQSRRNGRWGSFFCHLFVPEPYSDEPKEHTNYKWFWGAKVLGGEYHFCASCKHASWVFWHGRRKGKTEVILVDLNKLLIKVTRAATEGNSAYRKYEQ